LGISSFVIDVGGGCARTQEADVDHNDLTPAEVACLLGAAACPQLEQPAFQRSFHEIYRQLAAHLQGVLSHVLAGELNVEPANCQTTTYGEFVLRARDRKCLLRTETSPDLGPVFLDLAPSLLGVLVDRMLGDPRGGATGDFEPATEIEQRLAGEAYRQIAGAFCELWQDILPVRLADLQRQDDLTRSRWMPAEESLTILEYAISLDLRKQSLYWILPEQWPVRAVQRAVAAYCPANSEIAFSGGSFDTAAAAQHELVAELAETDMKTEELIDLRVGDVLQTSKDVGQPLTVRLDGVPRFRANLGKLSDRKAIEIVEVLDQQQPDDDAVQQPPAKPASPADVDV
jgi:flagellar motor switch protein FliM